MAQKTRIREEGSMVIKDEDKPAIRELAFEVGKELMTQFKDELDNALKIHRLECPTTKTVDRWTAQMRVIVFVVAIIGYLAGYGTAASGLLKLF
jgi:hypothetical protein